MSSSLAEIIPQVPIIPSSTSLPIKFAKKRKKTGFAQTILHEYKRALS